MYMQATAACGRIMIGPSFAVMPAGDHKCSDGFGGEMSVLIQGKNRRELYRHIYWSISDNKTC